MVTGEILNCIPGFCAGPTGKAKHIPYSMRRTGTIGILSVVLDGNGKHLADEVLAEIAIGAPQLVQIDSGADLGYLVVCSNQIARTEV